MSLMWSNPIPSYTAFVSRHAQGRVAGIKVSLAKKLPKREESSNGTTPVYLTCVLMNRREKKKKHKADMTETPGKSLYKEEHYGKGDAEKNKITFKSCSKFEFISDER